MMTVWGSGVYGGLKVLGIALSIWAENLVGAAGVRAASTCGVL